MIYFENASQGKEGFNTHVMSWTMCVSLSNFLDRDFYFDSEIPCSTPPDYASHPDLEKKFSLLLESPRSLVSELVDIPNRRLFEIDRSQKRKAAFELLYSHFMTTDEIRQRFEGTVVWDLFAVGRIGHTREELADQDLIEWTHTKLANPSVFYFLAKDEKRALLDSIKLKFLDDVEQLAAKINEDIGPHNAVHLRLGDYFENYGSDGYALDVDRFREYVRTVFGSGEGPLLVATDGLQEKETISRILAGYPLIFIDELVFDEYRRNYAALPFTDFNVLTIINQLLCSSAVSFIGTYRSTFTSIIHRLRQERFGKPDFEFFPDEKVALLLDPAGRLASDRSGFFDWNRYSVFAESHRAISGMREWNHELSAVDV